MKFKQTYTVYGMEYACDGVWVPRELIQSVSKRKAEKHLLGFEIGNSGEYRDFFILKDDMEE